jgi:DegT/DnrJ/EryC1/StrS aminotransferase family
VTTTPNSRVATANVILEVGATPVFADIDPRSHNIDLDKAAVVVTPRTQALQLGCKANPRRDEFMQYCRIVSCEKRSSAFLWLLGY